MRMLSYASTSAAGETQRMVSSLRSDDVHDWMKRLAAGGTSAQTGADHLVWVHGIRRLNRYAANLI
jgi:hypothetical protein